VVPALADLTPSPSEREQAEAALRSRIDQMLAAGLATECAQRAYDSAEVNVRVARLAAIPGGDLRGKLVTAGFTRESWIPVGEDDLEQSCATCMYYEAHRKFCALPELMLPVESTWSCVLWRI
jgi:hypothetical protein